MNVDPALVAVVDCWDDPRYGLRMTRDDLMRAAREGVDAASAEAGIRRMIPAYHEGLVVLLAKERVGRGLDLDDLKQEGNLGLIRAAAKFSPGRTVGGVPVRFSQYASRWVKEFMYSAIQEHHSIIRIPRYLDAQLKRLRDGGVRLATPDHKRRKLLAQGTEAKRRVAKHNSRGGWSWADTLVDPRVDRDRGGDFPTLDRMVAALCDSERAAIALRYGLDGRGDRTMREIGEELGIDPQAARKRVMRGMDTLRQSAEQRGVGFADLMSA